MKIVVIAEWFAEKMGYAENCLPKALAALGHEVHMVTSNAQPYFRSPNYAQTYAPFIGPGIVDCEVKPFDGYTLHRLPLGQCRDYLYIRGLARTLAQVRPDVVQTFDVYSWTACQAAMARPRLGFKLFLESHMHASVFSQPGDGSAAKRAARRLMDAAVCRLVGRDFEKCYPISQDAAEIVIRHFGIPPGKIEVCSLGVDTDLFTPLTEPTAQQARRELRRQLGFTDREIVCVYTGRFSQDKAPILLARAIDRLTAQGAPFRGLFVGNGPEKEVATIRTCRGCVVHDFVPTRDLPPFYWASDIGVWPKQESTSQLDAAACGLPILISDRTQVRERIEGNGLTYAEGDPDDLAQMLQSLIDSERRQQLGAAGAAKMRAQFSWKVIAEQRLRDFAASLPPAGPL